jgi:hypothetical protein
MTIPKHYINLVAIFNRSIVVSAVILPRNDDYYIRVTLKSDPRIYLIVEYGEDEVGWYFPESQLYRIAVNVDDPKDCNDLTAYLADQLVLHKILTMPDTDWLPLSPRSPDGG